jgi:hypothetical protein
MRSRPTRWLETPVDEHPTCGAEAAPKRRIKRQSVDGLRKCFDVVDWDQKRIVICARNIAKPGTSVAIRGRPQAAPEQAQRQSS